MGARVAGPASMLALAGLVVLCLCSAACAEGPRGAAAAPGVQGGSSEALRGVTTVHLMASDSSVHARATQRMKKATSLRLADAPAQDIPVLSLQFDCGTDFVFTERSTYRLYCLGMDDTYVEDKLTPPQTASGSCIASLVLSQGGQPLWWSKDTVRVGSRNDVASATDRMVDRFTAAWRGANP